HRQVAAAARVLAGQRRGQRDALVGGPEQEVEADAGGVDGIGVAAGQGGQRGARVEAAGIEEVRAVAARLQGEFPEAKSLDAQYLLLDPMVLVEGALVEHGLHSPTPGSHLRHPYPNVSCASPASTRSACAWPRARASSTDSA